MAGFLHIASDYLQEFSLFNCIHLSRPSPAAEKNLRSLMKKQSSTGPIGPLNFFQSLPCAHKAGTDKAPGSSISRKSFRVSSRLLVASLQSQHAPSAFEDGLLASLLVRSQFWLQSKAVFRWRITENTPNSCKVPLALVKFFCCWKACSFVTSRKSFFDRIGHYFNNSTGSSSSSLCNSSTSV